MNVNGVFKYSQREHKSLALCNSFYTDTEWFTPPKGYPLVTVRTNEIHNSYDGMMHMNAFYMEDDTLLA